MADDENAMRLPLALGPVSNGEFLPLAASPADVRLARAVLDRAAAAADALAMDRRLFLRTAGGFRAFEISAEFQHRYRYPALTDTIKAKVLGLNAARLWGLDPNATRCALARDTLALNRPLARSLADEGELPAPWVPRVPSPAGRCCGGCRTSPAPGYRPDPEATESQGGETLWP